MSSNMPIIKFKIDHLKESIKARMMLSNNELEEILDKELQKAIDSFDFNSVLTKLIHTCLQEELKNYFTFGQGNKIIRNSIQQTFFSSVD